MKFHQHHWFQRPRIPGLIVWWCLCGDTFSHFDRTRLVLDGRRDGQTEGQSIYHASIVTHDKN